MTTEQLKRVNEPPPPAAADPPPSQPEAPPKESAATPSTPPPPASKPAPPEDKVREAIKGDQNFWERLLPKKSPEEKKGKKDEKPEEDQEPEADKPGESADKPGDKKSAAAEEKPKKRVARKEAPAPELDPRELIEASSAAGARAAIEALKPKVELPKSAPLTPDQFAQNLPEDWAEDAETYLEMSRIMPDKYAELPRKLMDYAKIEEQYISKWQREHPGERFDPEADEHEAWYDENTPDFDTKDFKKAERSIIRREVASEIEGEFKPQIEELKASRKAQEVQPVIVKESMTALAEILAGVKEDYAELAGKPEELSKLQETDPVGAEVAAQVAERTLPLVRAAIALHTGTESYNQHNPAHGEVYQLILQAEERLARIPPSERLDPENRQFLRREEYVKLSKHEQARYWYIGQPEILEIINGRARALSEKLYQTEQKKLESWAKARGYNKSDERSISQDPKTKEGSKTPETPITERSEPTPPSVSGRAASSKGATPASTPPKSGSDLFFDRLLGT